MQLGASTATNFHLHDSQRPREDPELDQLVEKYRDYALNRCRSCSSCAARHFDASMCACALMHFVTMSTERFELFVPLIGILNSSKGRRC